VNRGLVEIKEVLERLYLKYNYRRCIKPDPLQFLYRYSDRCDIEVAGFLASALAYGRVAQIEKSLEDLFGRMGCGPGEFIKSFDGRNRRKLKSFKHRFTSGDDISDLLELLRSVLKDYGSLEEFFLCGYNKSDLNVLSALGIFCDSLYRMYYNRHNREPGRGLKYLVPKPSAGSACKRLNLFLRWMVRRDRIDTGLWKSVDKAKLIVPMDVHMSRISKMLKFHTKENITLRTAVEVTEEFAKIAPQDPVRYDFSLCRIGISGGGGDWGDIVECSNYTLKGSKFPQVKP